MLALDTSLANIWSLKGIYWQWEFRYYTGFTKSQCSRKLEVVPPLSRLQIIHPLPPSDAIRKEKKLF